MGSVQGHTASKCQSWYSDVNLSGSKIYLLKKYMLSTSYVPGISRSWDNSGQNKIVIRPGLSPGRGTQGCQVVGSAMGEDEPR